MGDSLMVGNICCILEWQVTFFVHIPVGSLCVYVTFLFFFSVSSPVWIMIFTCVFQPSLYYYFTFTLNILNTIHPFLNHLLMAWGLFYSRFYRDVLWIQYSTRSSVFKLFPKSWCLMDSLVRLKSLQLTISFCELLQSTAAPWSCSLLSFECLMPILFFSLFKSPNPYAWRLKGLYVSSLKIILACRFKFPIISVKILELCS